MLTLGRVSQQIIKNVKRSGKEELTIKGLTKEGVEEPVTVADTLSNKVKM